MMTRASGFIWPISSPAWKLRQLAIRWSRIRLRSIEEIIRHLVAGTGDLTRFIHKKQSRPKMQCSGFRRSSALSCIMCAPLDIPQSGDARSEHRRAPRVKRRGSALQFLMSSEFSLVQSDAIRGELQGIDIAPARRYESMIPEARRYISDAPSKPTPTKHRARQ